jgi:competence protein ComEC
MERQHMPEKIVGAGDSLDLGGGVEAHVAGPFVTSTSMDPNETSVVLRVVYGDSTLLLTGDAGFESEQRMIAAHQDLSAQILKVGHHGSRYASGADFLALVHPQIALVSVAAQNSYGHPGKEAMDRLVAIGAKVFRTDQLGDLVWISDGGEWRQP